MSVEIESTEEFAERATRVWGEVGTLFVQAQARTDAQIGDLREQVNRLELATAAGFNRIDARFERLVKYIERDELKEN